MNWGLRSAYTNVIGGNKVAAVLSGCWEFIVLPGSRQGFNSQEWLAKWLPDKSDVLSFSTKDAGLALAAKRLVRGICRAQVLCGPFCTVTQAHTAWAHLIARDMPRRAPAASTIDICSPWGELKDTHLSQVRLSYYFLVKICTKILPEKRKYTCGYFQMFVALTQKRLNLFG